MEEFDWLISIPSDEGLMLGTSALQIFHGGNSTFINSFDKTKFFNSNPFAGSAKPLLTRLIAYRFRVSVPHRQDTTVSLEMKPFIDLSPLLTGYFGALESNGHRVYL